jgi:hypothetical protein
LVLTKIRIRPETLVLYDARHVDPTRRGAALRSSSQGVLVRWFADWLWAPDERQRAHTVDSERAFGQRRRQRAEPQKARRERV